MLNMLFFTKPATAAVLVMNGLNQDAAIEVSVVLAS